MQRIIEFLKKNPVFYYATVDGDQARVRPFGFYMERNGRLYFGMGTHKPCYKQTVTNPKVEICTADAEGRWIRIRGTAVVDTDPDALNQAYKVMPPLTKMYGEETGLTLGLVYLTNGEAELCDMQGNCERFSF